MDGAGLNKSEVAELIGRSKSHVTQLLDGDANLTLRTLALLGLACNVRWDLRPSETAVWSQSKKDAPPSTSLEAVHEGPCPSACSNYAMAA